MADQYILAHDMGTSADKAVLVRVDGEIVETAKQEYPIYHPHPNWAEQNPDDWWDAIGHTTRAVLKKSRISPEKVVGVTFSSQTQSLVPVDEAGAPLRPAMSWLDGRAADIVREKLWTPPRYQGFNIPKVLTFIKLTGGAPGKTGKDQIGKILWLQENESEIFQQTYKFLDAKDYIIYKLTGRMTASVDIAVIWWMLDTRNNRNEWHPKLCKMAHITSDMLPEVKPSAAIVGQITSEAAKHTGLKSGTPVINGAGDLAAAALGSGGILDGEMHICVGTSGWVAGHFSKRKIDLPHYTGCIGSAYPEKYYLGMAHQETIGICLEWLRNHVLYHKDQLQKEYHVSEVYEIFSTLAGRVVPGSEGLMFTPWMYGERCPIDDDYVRGGLFNIGLNHSREHIIRAVFEGIAFNLRWAKDTLEALYSPVRTLRIIGGGASSDVWCQIFADVMDRRILRVKDPRNAGAKGVALLAAMTLGHIDSFESIKEHIHIDRIFEPNPENRLIYDRLYREFQNLYKQNKKWYKRMNRER
jgi:xylulokinase